MPTQAQMSAHNSQHSQPTGSVQSIPRSQYAESRHMHPQSIASVSTNPRPTLNIFANRNGDIAYQPDPRWSQAFGKKGYKVNVLQVRDLDDVKQGPCRMHGQYAMKSTGALRVNGQKVAMAQIGDETKYTLDGYEHGTTYAPNTPYYAPGGEIRRKEPKKKKYTARRIMCVGGVLAVGLIACLSPLCCHY
jgi:hypothetical protein